MRSSYQRIVFLLLAGLSLSLLVSAEKATGAAVDSEVLLITVSLLVLKS